MIVDFLLDLTVKVFGWLKKKSKNTYWTNMELVNSQKLKQQLLTQIIEDLIKIGVEVPEELKTKIGDNNGK